jgi:hypothetical protein
MTGTCRTSLVDRCSLESPATTGVGWVETQQFPNHCASSKAGSSPKATRSRSYRAVFGGTS